MKDIFIQKKHCKTLRMRITADGNVIVSAPLSLSEKKIHDRIASKKEWIQKTRTRLATKQGPSLQDNQCLLFGDIYTRVAVATPPLDTTHKTIYLPSGTSKDTRLRTLAGSYLRKKMDYRKQKHGYSFNKLFIRSQTTKRGTCSSNKHISLNRKLITLPERVIDYVICHELAHLTHMNHSKLFRDHCISLYPRTKEAKQRLKQNGHIIN